MGAERSRKATLGGRWQTAPQNGADCWSGQVGRQAEPQGDAWWALAARAREHTAEVDFSTS